MLTRTRKKLNGNDRHSSHKTEVLDRARTLDALSQFVADNLSRAGLAARLGYQYGDKRKLYEALGYPTDGELTYEWYYNKYDRQDIANAIIDRPADATWSGSLEVIEKGKPESPFSKQWRALNKKLKIKQRLCKVDKLAHIGRFALLLFGFDDVKKVKDFKRPLTGKNRKLLYLKQVSECEVQINEFESDPANERYGLPKFYQIKVGTVQSGAFKAGPSFQEIIVHHSRVLHIVSNNLTSEVYGTPKLKPVANRLVDLEKILGGDAETFWRGARPGYHAAAKEDYEMSTPELEALEEELDKYEHDLRRFISAKGVDIKALEQQVAEPLNHIDAQIQAISAQTGIPKRILIGSERGELSSGQDSDQWLSLIRTRMEEFAETNVLRPLIEKCMEVGALPSVEEYNVMWEDVFAPSEAKKVEIGRKRSDALKAYFANPLISDMLPPALALKHLLGLNEEQVEEALRAMEAQKKNKDRFSERLIKIAEKTAQRSAIASKDVPKKRKMDEGAVKKKREVKP